MIRREVTHKGSRFDFYIEDGDRKAFFEVKGCTLEHGGRAEFPDAPTERGVKHLKELAGALEKRYESYVLFVIQMKGVHLFTPNNATHPAFGETLKIAAGQGVKIIAMDCQVTPDTIEIDKAVKIRL